MAVPAIATISSAWRSTIEVATASPSAAASNTSGGSSATRLSGTRPKYIACITCRGRRNPKCSATPDARDVRRPRPSSDRTACHRAASPMSEPPPQSPAIQPSAGKRYVLPSGATAEQLVPNPQTTPTPHVRSVPARSTANVSLRSTVSSVQPCCRTRRRIERSSEGRSAPARQNTPREARGDRAGSAPALREAASTADTTGASSPFARAPSDGPTRGRTEQRAVARHDDGVHLRAASVDRDQGRPAHGSASSSSTVANDAPARSKPSSAIGTASARRARPRVEQHHGAVPVLRRARDGVVADLVRGPPGLPVLGLDVPVHVAVPELARARPAPARRRGRRRTGTGTTASGRRPRARRSLARRRGRPRAARRPRAASCERGRSSGCRSGGRRRRSGGRGSGSPSPTGPARRTSPGPALGRARPGCAGCRPRPAAGRSGCSASNVSATRGASLTRGHLRGPRVHAGDAPAGVREPPREELDRDDRDRRREQPVDRRDPDPERALGHLALRRDHHHRGARARPGRRRAEGRGSASRVRSRRRRRPDRDPRARTVRAGTRPSRRTRPCTPHSFSVSAPISAAARAGPLARTTSVSRSARCRRYAGPGSRRRARSPRPRRPRGRPSLARSTGTRPRSRPTLGQGAGDRRQLHERGRERHRGRTLLRPRPGVEPQVGALGERVRRARSSPRARPVGRGVRRARRADEPPPRSVRTG